MFDNKYPSINDSEREIAKALIKYGYIKERVDGRIMLIKRKNKDLDSGYVNDEILHKVKKYRKYLNKVFFFYQLINVRIQDKIYMNNID